MNIGVDIDGVLANQVKSVNKLIEHRYDIKIDFEEVNQWDYWTKHGILKRELLKLMEKTWTNYYWIEPIEPHLDQLTKALNEVNTITIISHRTRKSFPFVCKWLDMHKISYDNLIFVRSGNKLEYPIECLIDDAPDMIEKAKEFPDKTLYLRMQGWNKSITDLPNNVIRVNSLAEACQLILK